VTFTGTFRSGGRERRVSVTLKDGVLRGTLDGKAIPDTPVSRSAEGILLGAGRDAVRAVVARDGGRVLVHVGGRVHEFEIPDRTKQRRASPGRRHQPGDEAFAISPMTGTVVQVAVKAGDAVPAGAPLLVVEAMKMQFVVRAPRPVVVKAVHAAAGKPVDIGAVLVEFET